MSANFHPLVYIIDYILGVIMWTLIGRVAMNIFQKEDSQFFFMKVFVKFTNPLLNIFKPMPQILENILVKDKNIINKLKCKKAIMKANKLMGRNGRLLVRKSGTEPKIRIMGESYNKNLIIKCIKIVKQSIKY